MKNKGEKSLALVVGFDLELKYLWRVAVMVNVLIYIGFVIKMQLAG